MTTKITFCQLNPDLPFCFSSDLQSYASNVICNVWDQIACNIWSLGKPCWERLVNFKPVCIQIHIHTHTHSLYYQV